MLDAFLKQLQLDTYQMLKHITITLKLLTKRRKQNEWTIALYPNK